MSPVEHGRTCPSDACVLCIVFTAQHAAVTAAAVVQRSASLTCVRVENISCIDAAKRGFYRAANSIFGKVGRTASDEVVLHLVKYKCMPILLYGFDVLNLNKSQLNSLDFVANRFMMKRFNTNNM